MRYFQKLLCLLILVLAASFGVGGCVLLYSDFSVQRSRMAAANAAAHAQACTLLQTEILDLQRRGISTGDAALTARVTAQDVPAALWRGDTLVCATLEGLQSLPLGDAATVTVRTENSIYAVYASDLQGGLRLVTAYDLTGLYRDRNAALMRFLLLEAAVLAAASAVTALLARRLTRPLAVLTDAGAQIAAGDYARRTDLHTGDEIEALSRSFDKMADAVQEKIADLEADVQRREDFVGAFTHELKTPMTSIIGYADMLHTMQTDPDEQREAAAAIVHEGRRLEALSRKLLALLGLNEEGVELTAVPLPALWPRLHAACPDVTLRTPAAAPTVRGDADLLLDLLCNLVQNAAKALMIRHEQRVGLMDRDWHPFEARMAPMLNAIGLHFATEGFTPAKRGHAKNFLAWGYFQGADYFKDQAETIRAELLPIENPEHGFTAAAAAFAREIEASPFPVCLHWRCGDYLLPQNAALQVCTPEYYAAACRTVCQSLPQAELFVFSDDPAYVRQHLDAAGLPVHYSTGAKSAAADLALMRRCRAFVLSNSTFSWWGQWLAGVPGRCVIAPDRWYANGKKTALYDHDWTLIPTK